MVARSPNVPTCLPSNVAPSASQAILDQIEVYAALLGGIMAPTHMGFLTYERA